MKRVLVFCVALSLVGCAGKGAPKQPVPVNPTAKIEHDEVFAGQNALEEKVKAAGSLRGRFAILDTPGSFHARSMEGIAKDIMGIPEENLTIVDFSDRTFFFKEEVWQRLLEEEVQAIAVPDTWASTRIPSNKDIPLVAQHDILFVAAAGNTSTFGSRDLWYPEHANWREEGRWEIAFTRFATGKVILATYARRTYDDGRFLVHEATVRCGLAKEYCYSVINPGGDRGTSSASTQLGALTFYLFQLWDTPQEVVGVLNTCAEDVGEPGIDEDFGRGVVSVVCDTVQSKERQIVSSSLQTSHAASPVLSAMLGSSRVPLQTSPRSFFYALNPHSGTGHVGKQFSVGRNDLFLSGGLSRMPLGVRTLLRQAHRVPFMEIGSRGPFYERNGHKLSLLGTYGQSAEDGFSVRVGHLGLRYELTLPSADFSLHTGYRLANGQLGLPGHEVVGAAPVPFTTGAPELSVSLALGL